MKTNELQGAALDWAVAKCEGHEYYRFDGKHGRISTGQYFNPSTDWSQGGPIIEREVICVYEMPGHVGGKFRAEKKQQNLPPNVNGTHYAAGNTYLETAMRCYVASKLGDEVEIPEELTC